MKLKEMRQPELAKKEKINFILPIGSTEQHGPFAPFGTDTYINDHLIGKIEKRFPNVVILPTLEYSKSHEHRGFFGTISLSKNTLEKILFDICHSIYKKASIIFISSFHRNYKIINKFVREKSNSFQPAKIINLEMHSEENKQKFQKLLDGPVDRHAGNTEISSMLVINKNTVRLPSKKDKKTFIADPFGTDNIAEKSKNGVADNHPNWVVNKKIGKESLEIYFNQMVKNIKKYLK